MPYVTPQNTPTAICRRVFIPDDPVWLAAFNGALLELTNADNWESELPASLTPEAAAEIALGAYERYFESDCVMIGAILPFATQNAPSGTLYCDGATYNAVDYPDLYDALDAVYKTATTFTVPDMRNRVVRGDGANAVGSTGGNDNEALSSSQIPAHTHTVNTAVAVFPVTIGTGVPVSVMVPPTVPTPTTSAGLGLSHNNIPAYGTLKFCIVTGA